MKSINLPQVIPTLSKFYHKIISVETLKQHIQLTTHQQLTNSQIYKIMYHLRTKWYMISCKKDLFYIKPASYLIQEDQIVAQYYWKLLDQHCRSDCKTQWYIWWLSALELVTGVSQFSMEEAIIVNEHKTSKEVICFDNVIIYKSYRTSQGWSLFNTTKKYTQTISVPWAKIKHASLELALLETLYSPARSQQSYIKQYIIKLLKKHKKTLNWSVLESIIKKGKFHSSFNRLYHIAKDVDSLTAQHVHELIKKYSYVMEI